MSSPHRAARWTAAFAVFLFTLTIRARGVSSQFWLLGAQIRDWSILGLQQDRDRARAPAAPATIGVVAGPDHRVRVERGADLHRQHLRHVPASPAFGAPETTLSLKITSDKRGEVQRLLAYEERNSQTQWDLMILPVDGNDVVGWKPGGQSCS